MPPVLYLLLLVLLSASNASQSIQTPPPSVNRIPQAHESYTSDSAALNTSFPVDSSCDFTHLHPRRYAGYHLPVHSTISIDGVLDENVWREVPWSETFQDIRGPAFWTQPWFATKVKLRYDHAFLYIGAYLEETAVWANVSKRNDVIFNDNDFEVFVDPDGSTHNYKEFELNARNATWNLWLNRPYRDGGHENSTRVDPQHGFDMINHGMRSAVFVKGHINDPGEQLHYWTAEIALPFSQLALYSKAHVPPRPHSSWRINFSRVEWPVRVVLDSHTGSQHYEKISTLSEENWVWSAQFAVDMHRPEWWGYLYFRPHDERPVTTGEHGIPFDREWGVRFVSFQYYYAQHAFHKVEGVYASTLERLFPHFIHREAYPCVKLLDVSASTSTFRARIGLNDASEFVAVIQDDGYIMVEKVNFNVTAIE